MKEPGKRQGPGGEAWPPNPGHPLPYVLAAGLVGLVVAAALLPKRRR